MSTENPNPPAVVPPLPEETSVEAEAAKAREEFERLQRENPLLAASWRLANVAKLYPHLRANHSNPWRRSPR